MNKKFEYKGFATDWVGFQFDRDDKLYTVIAETSFREYQVTYPEYSGNQILTASQCDLMHEYILELESMVENYEQSAMERGEYD